MSQPKSILEKYQTLFDLNRELHDLADEIMSKGHADTSINGYFASVALAKATKTHGSIYLLASNGTGEDAAILSRTLIELAIITMYVLNDKSGAKAKRYLDYSAVVASESILKAMGLSSFQEEIEKRQINPKPGDMPIDLIHKLAKEFQTEHEYEKYRTHAWSTDNLYQMAKTVGCEGLYNLLYKNLSGLVHSDALAMDNYVEEGDHGLLFNASRNTNWVSQSLVMGFQFFYEVLRAFNEQVDFDIADRLEQIKNRWVIAVEKSE